jgi:hypothetical protein
MHDHSLAEESPPRKPASSFRRSKGLGGRRTKNPCNVRRGSGSNSLVICDLLPGRRKKKYPEPHRAIGLTANRPGRTRPDRAPIAMPVRHGVKRTIDPGLWPRAVANPDDRFDDHREDASELLSSYDGTILEGLSLRRSTQDARLRGGANAIVCEKIRHHPHSRKGLDGVLSIGDTTTRTNWAMVGSAAWYQSPENRSQDFR